MALSDEEKEFYRQYALGNTGDDGPMVGADEPGVLSRTAGHVLEALGLLDRPDQAIATAANAIYQGEGLGGAWTGLKKGWYNEPGAMLPSDVFGLEQGKSEDDWTTWLGKEIPRFAANTVLSPTTYVGGAVLKPLKATASYGKAARALGGTSFGKAMMRSTWGRPEVDEALIAGQRRLGERLAERQGLYDTAKGAEDLIPEDLGTLGAREAFERNLAGLPDDTAQAWAAQHAMSANDLQRVNALRVEYGLNPIEAITESDKYRFVPRVTTEKGARYIDKDLKQGGRSSLNLRPDEIEARSLKRIEGIDDETGLPFVTKPEFLSKTDTGQYLYKGKPVTISEASLQDIYRAHNLNIPEGSFLPSPSESFLADQMKKINQQTFLETLGQGIKEGWVSKLEKGVSPADGMREVNIPGFKGYAAEKVVANRLENLARVQMDPDTSIGAVGDLIHRAFQSRPGQLLDKATKSWVTNTLFLHPGFHLANAATNAPLAYLGGISTPKLIPRTVDAFKVYHETGNDVARGMSNAALKQEFSNRGLFSGWSGSEALDVIGKAKKESLVESTLGQTAGKVAAAGGKANELGMKVGQYLEANPRLAVAIDYLKKQGKDLATMDVEERAKLLDKAAAHAKKSMIDYELNPTQAELKKIFPFLGWNMGIAGRTGELLSTDPGRLARFNRLTDTVLNPMAPEDKAISDEYIKEGGYVSGLAGGDFGTDDMGNPQMFAAGRFLPQGTVEQLYNRPRETVWGMVNPFLKGPINLARNWNELRNQPIDPIAGGPGGQFPESVINPIRSLWSDEALYEPNQGKTLGMTLPKAWQYMVDMSPAGRHARELSGLMRTAGIYEDPYKPPQSTVSGLADYATGSRFYGWDRVKQMKNREYEHDAKANVLTKDMNRAASKGDMEGLQHALEMLMKHQERRGKYLGWSEPAN